MKILESNQYQTAGGNLSPGHYEVRAARGHSDILQMSFPRENVHISLAQHGMPDDLLC